MDKNIMNITSDGRVVCDQFDMSLDEFFKLMLTNIKRDHELYHVEYRYKVNSYFAIYKGKEYRVMHDGKKLEEVEDKDMLDHHFHVNYNSLSRVFPYCYFPDDSKLDKLLAFSRKKEQIDRYNKWIKETEEQKKFFNKNKFLGLNDLNITEQGIERLGYVNIVLTMLLMFCNMCGFFIPAVQEFYKAHEYLFIITLIPYFTKSYFDACAAAKNKKRTLAYYVFYPILYLFSRINCKKDIKMDKKFLHECEESYNKYYDSCIDEINKSLEKEEVKEEKENGSEERYKITNIKKLSDRKEKEEVKEEKVNVLKKSKK